MIVVMLLLRVFFLNTVVSFLLSICQVPLSFLSVVLHGTEIDGGQDQPNKNIQTPVFFRAVEGRHILSVSCLVVEKISPPCWGYKKKKESLATQSYLALCNPMDCSLAGSSVHGIFQARVLEWVAVSFSRGSFWPRDRTRVSHIVGRRFTIWATREVLGDTQEVSFQRGKCTPQSPSAVWSLIFRLPSLTIWWRSRSKEEHRRSCSLRVLQIRMQPLKFGAFFERSASANVLLIHSSQEWSPEPETWFLLRSNSLKAWVRHCAS